MHPLCRFAVCVIFISFANSFHSPARAQSVSIIHSFGTSAGDGLSPIGGLFQASDGTLYGTTSSGGQGFGTIFKITTSGTITTLHTFGDGTVANDGQNPNSALMMASDGYLYGTTTNGGAGSEGTVFRISTSGVMNIVHAFGDGHYGNDGYQPYSGLIQASDGFLYGTTESGGLGYGTIYKMALDGAEYAVLHFFGSGVANDGNSPFSGVIQASDGFLYGTTSGGGGAVENSTSGGTVYKISTSGDMTILHSFGDGSVASAEMAPYPSVVQAGDGMNPYAPLVQASDGNLYGTTKYGGSTGNSNLLSGDGVVFKITTSGTVTILHSFGDGSVANDGVASSAGLVQGADGFLYGVTIEGGSANEGTAFKISTTGTETILHSFGDGSVSGDGQAPTNALILATDGNFYGATKNGGTQSDGTVFRLTPQAPIPHRFDFNGDGTDDLLFQNSNGQTLVWDMNGEAVKSYGSVFTTVAPPWHIQAVADINADGHPDLLWWNSSTGECLLWEMAGSIGTTVLQYESSFASIPDTHWHPVSMADFDGDGHPDILWENSSTGQLLIWYMNGNTIKKYGSAFTTLPANWIVAGTADFNQDGHPDLLLENTKTGQVLVWYLSGALGTTILSYGSTFATLSDTNWSAVSTGDLNGDGRPDLTWHNKSTGATDVWLMGGPLGTTVESYGGNIGSVPTSWSIVGVH